MPLWLQVVALAFSTVGLFVLADRTARAFLDLRTKRSGIGARGAMATPESLKWLQVKLAGMVVRLAVTTLVAVVVALKSPHRLALVFTLGAVYFAAAVIDGVRSFRGRETQGCLTR